jgi:hypothetical protein
MAKLVLMSIVFAMVGIPVLAARDRSLRRGAGKTISLMVAASVLYYLAIRYVYPHLL